MWLSGADSASYESSTYYTQIVKYFPVEADAKSFALRMLIHYVGDVHQPLHAVAEVDSTYPSGDRGGNLETLPSVCGASNLHAMWDSVAYNYCGNPTTVSTTMYYLKLLSLSRALTGPGTQMRPKPCAKRTPFQAARFTAVTSKSGLKRGSISQSSTFTQVS